MRRPRNLNGILTGTCTSLTVLSLIFFRYPFYLLTLLPMVHMHACSIGTETSKRGTVAGRKQSASGGSSIYNADEEDADRVSDDDYLSDDVRSEVSDPVFKWLKRAV